MRPAREPPIHLNLGWGRALSLPSSSSSSSSVSLCSWLSSTPFTCLGLWDLLKSPQFVSILSGDAFYSTSSPSYYSSLAIPFDTPVIEGIHVQSTVHIPNDCYFFSQSKKTKKVLHLNFPTVLIMHCSTPANGRFQRQQVLITWVRCDCVIVTAISGDRVTVALSLVHVMIPWSLWPSSSTSTPQTPHSEDYPHWWQWGRGADWIWGRAFTFIVLRVWLK